MDVFFIHTLNTGRSSDSAGLIYIHDGPLCHLSDPQCLSRYITWVGRSCAQSRSCVGGEGRCSGALLGASPCKWPPVFRTNQKELVVLREATEPGKGDPPARGLGGLSSLRCTVVALGLHLTQWLTLAFRFNNTNTCGLTAQVNS